VEANVIGISLSYHEELAFFGALIGGWLSSYFKSAAFFGIMRP
jgi:hypothetical protein